MAVDLKRFNPSQKDAILSSSGALLILAGPGSGKTSVLIAKISQLIDSGIKPEKILAITFSRKATFEIEERLSRQTGASNVHISTLHAFCADLVQRHGFRLGLKQKVRMMTEAESHLFFRQMSPQLPLQPFMKTSNFEPIIDDLLEFFQKAKDEGLWPEDIIRFANDMPQSTPDEEQIRSEWMALGDLYNAYQSFCFEKGFIDFGDSVLCALRILQDFAIVREEVQKNYEAILVDEFQDTNWTQIQLLKMITAPSAHIAVVGDDDQSIYRFRGASYSAFQFFKDLFPELKTVELDQTYRLSPEILEAATELIQANGERRFRPNKKLSATKKSQGPVKLIKAASFEDEASAIADEIERLLKAGTKPNAIGVLVRAHGHADFLLAEAKKRNLPLEARTSLMLFDQEIIQDVMAFFKVLMRPDDSISFLRLLDSAFLRFSADDIYKICRATSGKTPILEILEKSSGLDISDLAKNSLKEFFELYKSLHGLSFRKPASEILLQIYQKSKAIAFLLENDVHTLKILGRFHSQLAEWEKIQPEKELQKLFPLLESFARRELSLDEESSTDLTEDRIPVLTVHASKGLEFENVFILSLVGRRFPQNFRQSTWKFPENLEREPSGTKEMHNEEERRLFYVAMTRAKKSLTLATVEKKGTRMSSFISEDLKDLLPKFDIVQRDPSTTETFSFFKPEIFGRTKKSEIKFPSLSGPLKLSFTQLDKYETCPLQYRFIYDIKIPVPSSPSLLVGAAVHTALEKFFMGIKNGDDPKKENLLTYFDTEFLNLQKNNSNLSAFDHQLGREKLGDYFDLHDGKFPIPFAIEQPFRLQIGEHFVSGKIDRADQTNEGMIIIDYKTGKSKSNESAKDRKFADESLQLSIYALAAKEVLGWNLKELVLYYIYDNQSLSSIRNDKDLEITKERILKIASQIQAQKFDAKPGFHCQWCEFRSLCPSAD